MSKLQPWFSFRPWHRHSLVLTIGGLVYISFGLSLFGAAPLEPLRQEALQIALRMYTLKTWGFIFLAAGALAIVSSRWPGFAPAGWGYAVLTGIAAAWGSAYLLNFYLLGGPQMALNYGLIWALMAFMWWAISGLVNPDRRRKARYYGPD